MLQETIMKELKIVRINNPGAPVECTFLRGHKKIKYNDLFYWFGKPKRRVLKKNRMGSKKLKPIILYEWILELNNDEVIILDIKTEGEIDKEKLELVTIYSERKKETAFILGLLNKDWGKFNYILKELYFNSKLLEKQHGTRPIHL